ncbi:hypothetical protein [Terrihalobacillus insolitus]|uniref:hypothetical protein n=1 Tax=Terrihalobacillus insolitus TaxID=2950438 RepID=UPI0023419C56|nr:hypothetical protein [Terrihalobacillus insolitus]MDC3412545.1 hypothetical protein [Terrihalobacillus insolitus]
MDNWQIYKVETVVQGMDFHYTPSIEVFADNEESAKEKAITLISRDMLVSKSLVRVVGIT